MFDYLVVGAGFAGATVAAQLARHVGKSVMVIDRRSHVAGNAYDHFDSAGVQVHQYGPHIFHTNSEDVVRFLSQYTEWRAYEHRVLAEVDGKLVPIPINIDTINRLYDLKLDGAGVEAYLESVAESIPVVRTAEDSVVSRVGRDLYEKMFRSYTRKQWGLDPSQLDAAVTARIPVRTNHDDRYFTDRFQRMPRHGYTRMFENMLDHPNIRLELSTSLEDVNLRDFDQVIYSGPVDAYFDYRFGKLPYRSLRFEHKTFGIPQVQTVAVINYPNTHAYTRCTEFKHMTGQHHPMSSVVYEYPAAEGDPYYPVPNASSAQTYRLYEGLVQQTNNVHFVGRLATYKYYNMDQVTAQALTLAATLAGASRQSMLPPVTNTAA